jgi:hypothetical protein|tara:strand:+ start:1854 stop:2531 length:678 start_codon:yes stop_codon:yes gene_type:complete
MSDDPLHLADLNPENIEQAKFEKGLSKKAKDPIAIKNAATAAAREERLARKAETPKEASSSKAPPPPPDPIDISALLDKVQAYRERFPHLKSRNKLSGKSSDTEVLDELHFIEQQLGRKDGHMGNTLYLMAMAGLENSTQYYNPLNLNLSGLTNVAKDNMAELTPIIDELVIKYATNFYVTPEMRLCTATAMMIYTVHSANTGNTTAARAMAAMHKKVMPDSSEL